MCAEVFKADGEASVGSPPIGVSRLRRFSGYAFWSGAEQVIMLGFPRLILFPLLAWILTGPEFGDFIIALSVVQMMGVAPTNGVYGYVMRDAANHSHEDQTAITRTALVLSMVLLSVIGLVLIVGNSRIAALWPDSRVGALLPLMGVYLLWQNITMVATSMWRVRRQFARTVVVRAVESVLLFSAIPLYYVFGLGGVALGFAIAGLASLLAVIAIDPEPYRRGMWYDRDFARGIFRVWAPLSISALIYLSSGYVDRLLLGYWRPTGESGELAAFFVATSIARLFLIPGNQAAGLLSSLLGRVRSSDRFGRRFYRVYALALVGTNLLLIVVGVAIGPYVLRFFYPQSAAQAAPLWIWAVVAASLLSLQNGGRPFVVKFLPPMVIPVLTVISVVSRVVPIVLLVPGGGAMGAVQAMLIGTAISAFCWFGLFCMKFAFSDTTHESVIVASAGTAVGELRRPTESVNDH